jgi:hypothetical protein
MAQQKSEDRVVPEGGVIPVERAGSSPGGQGKAVPRNLSSRMRQRVDGFSGRPPRCRAC